PANILLTKRGEPKLTDFGLARQETTDSEQTKAGVVIGTLDFMSPEQRRDATATDGRSDLWSLAATLYQMVTGKSPKVIRLDQVAESLRPVLGQALEEDPTDRFQDSASLRDALKTVLANQEAGSQGLAEGELVEGCCAKCGVVNDLDRKFCKSCAAPLREPCLACEAENAVWERICGECGSNVPQLVGAKQREIAAQKREVESLRRQYRYEEAIDQLGSLLVGDHPRFSAEKDWIEETVRSFESEQQQQRKRCQPIVDSAGKELANHKFAEAIKLLQAIPAALRDREILDLLKQSQSNQQEKERLAKEIKEQMAAKELTGLLEKANRFLELAPGHPQIMKLQRQLLSRQKKVASQGTAVLERAEQLYSEHRDEEVLKVLSHWPSGLQQPARAAELYSLSSDRLASASQPIDLGSIPHEMPGTRNRPAIILPGTRREKPLWQQPWVLATAGAGFVVLIVLIVLLNSGGDQSPPDDKQNDPVVDRPSTTETETPSATITPSEKQSGWKLLFDGKTTKGWRNYQANNISSGWKVIEGALTQVDKAAGDIVTEDQYDSFELSLEYKVATGAKSGLLYHVIESESFVWQSGPEVQIQDNINTSDRFKAGWLYQLYSTDLDTTRPAGEWNELRIRITPELCEHSMNGVKYFSYVKGS
ncbi:MAG TPA: DUF1080 domain-containing protein, partial [Planctomycetaceae bacterium]|nr:DUF1080 domain-containing protein [Planctomycetaceae bacterium]